MKIRENYETECNIAEFAGKGEKIEGAPLVEILVRNNLLSKRTTMRNEKLKLEGEKKTCKVEQQNSLKLPAALSLTFASHPSLLMLCKC